MGEGWQLLTIRGIPLRIHPSWFVILLLATLGFQQQYALSLRGQLTPAALWAVALVTSLALFVSVLLHELGHSLVALQQGVKVKSITLFLLGGVASVERECSTARGALMVAAAGPAVSLVLGISLLASTHAASHLTPVLGQVVERLGALNLILGLFNLLPGLPLDGGLIVKALVWEFSGSQRRGVEVANACGRFLSLFAVGMGTVLLLRGGGIGGVWLILLGWFGLGAARNQKQMLVVQQALKDLKVRDVAQRRFRVLEADTSLRELSRIRLGTAPPIAAPAGKDANGPAEWLLVCDRGRWQGVIDDAPLQAMPVQCWDRERVGDHLQPLSSLPAIPESAPLWQAALQLDDGNHQRLLVLSPAGLPCGTVERPELGDAVLKKLGLRLPANLLSVARRENGYPLGMALGQVARGMVSSGEVSPLTDKVAR